ncbi:MULTISPECIES: SDR family oxidoreductase [unclassified Rhodococcus (in: high G+C Gram-positive bacteria)]|uniref:SDR family NAD(P)-dependent oxidoreductase n=1 Tax=unclassified Rhodococcus (in: high G+C Gram-positive bacteria) TaxID=192944 RepID=UPI001FFA08D8|nr:MULTISPECIES: SDR family oxidoreductase [unclassified Rhodococcus (in: high G+C Gram-positive bacteria)]
MTENLTGKIALITGGGQGIGRGVALEFARAGAKCFLVGRTRSKLEAVAEEVAQVTSAADVAVYEVDIASDGACEAAVSAAMETFGGVDILVNNANSAFPVPLDESGDDFFDYALRTGPRAVLRLMRAVHPSMVERGGGVIITMITSSAVRWDTSGFGVYAATKEAMRVLTRTASSEWGHEGIRAHCVAPHALTPALEWWIENNPEEAEEFVRTIPMGRIGDPERDIGQAVAFLASDSSRYLSGAVIPLDGGQSRW